MSVSAIATGIIDALKSALGLIPELATGLKDAFVEMFFTTTGTGESATTSISQFAVVLLIFGGVSLAFGLIYLVYNLIRSKVGK